eukprot:4895122-Karenia_brevis.AAC.1
MSNVTSWLTGEACDRGGNINSFMDIESFMSSCFMSSSSHDPYIEICEVCGGEARTTQVMIRRHMRGGRNSDIVFGTDPHEEREQRLLFEYIR